MARALLHIWDMQSDTIELHATNPLDNDFDTVRRRKRRRWDLSTKLKITEQVNEMLAAGQSWKTISETVDVLEGSLRQWLKQYSRNPHPRALSAPSAANMDAYVSRAAAALGSHVHVSYAGEGHPNAVPSGISVTTPDGIRIDGLDVDGAMALVELLRAQPDEELDD